MSVFPPDFRLDYSLINWLDYRAERINPTEVESAYRDPGIQYYPIRDPETGDIYDYFIGFGSAKRFLLVLLKVDEQDVEKLLVHKILVADEPQIRERYYKPKF
jgi:hypothetical protein